MKGWIETREVKDGTIKYYPRVTHNGRRHSLGGYPRRKDAESALRKAWNEMSKGTFGKDKPEDMTLAAWIDLWLEGKKMSLKDSTYVSYSHTFRGHILPFFGKKHLTNINPSHVQEWVNYVAAKDISPATVHKAYRYLRACFNAAVLRGQITVSPCRGIDLPRVPHKELDFLQPSEVNRLLEVSEGPERMLFAVLALSGLRLGEALALRWRDVDFEMNALRITRSWSYHGGFQEPKTETSRRAIPMLPTLARELRSYEGVDSAPDDLLFTFNGTQPLDPSNVRRRFDAALEDANLKHVTMHSLRHTYASVMLASDANIKALQRALGHANATMTLNTYSHLIEEGLDSALMRADALFSGANGKVIPLKRRL